MPRPPSLTLALGVLHLGLAALLLKRTAPLSRHDVPIQPIARKPGRGAVRPAFLDRTSPLLQAADIAADVMAQLRPTVRATARHRIDRDPATMPQDEDTTAFPWREAIGYDDPGFCFMGLRFAGGGACPEQYDVFLGNMQVAYLRLRHGRFTVELTPPGPGPRKPVLVHSSTDVQGDGCFEEEERHTHFVAAARAIRSALGLAPIGPGGPD